MKVSFLNLHDGKISIQLDCCSVGDFASLVVALEEIGVEPDSGEPSSSIASAKEISVPSTSGIVEPETLPSEQSNPEELSAAFERSEFDAFMTFPQYYGAEPKRRLHEFNAQSSRSRSDDILRILREAAKPLTTREIAEQLFGVELRSHILDFTIPIGAAISNFRNDFATADNFLDPVIRRYCMRWIPAHLPPQSKPEGPEDPHSGNAGTPDSIPQSKSSYNHQRIRRIFDEAYERNRHFIAGNLLTRLAAHYHIDSDKLVGMIESDGEFRGVVEQESGYHIRIRNREIEIKPSGGTP